MKNFSLIYLASGFSKRFGSNKLLSIYKKRRIFEYGLDSLLSAVEKHNLNDEIIVVTQYEEVAEYAREKKVKFLLNTHAADGISASIKSGINASSEKTDAYLFLVADQPMIKNETIFQMMKNFEQKNYEILQACTNIQNDIGVKQISGNPVIFSKTLKSELLLLSGDTGGRKIIMRHPELTENYFVSNSEELNDIDFKADLKCLPVS